MKSIAFAVVAASTAALALYTTPALALANRTFVSGHGSDSNPCSLPAPCRSFQTAHDQTSAGGEITVLDPAGYGPVTITKAISIINDGVGEAAITATLSPGNTVGGNGITINAGNADIVNLRGLTIDGMGIGNLGIFEKAGGPVNIQRCNVSGFTSNGIYLNPGVATVNISDTTVTGSLGSGIVIAPSSNFGPSTAALIRVQVLQNAQFGIGFYGTNSSSFKATVANSLISENSAGINTEIGGYAGPLMVSTIVSSQIVNNSNSGLQVFGTATAFVGHSVVSGNGSVGALLSGGALVSFGDNDVKGNTGGDNPPGTTASAE